jgi:hypothetical protein
LPGLVQHVEEHTGATVINLHPAAAGSGALAHADRIRSSGPSIPFITRLPGLDARPPGPVTVPVTPPIESSRHLPSHLVLGGAAHRIESDPLTLLPEGIERAEMGEGAPTVRRLAGQAVLEAPAEAGLTLNGDPIEGRTALAPGDRLRLAASDGEILVVTMAE